MPQGGGQNTWTRVQEVPVPSDVLASINWRGDVLPTLDRFQTNLAAYDGSGLALVSSGRTDIPAYNGEDLAIAHELREQFSEDRPAGFALEPSPEGWSFGRVSYHNVGAIELTPSPPNVAQGWIIRGQSADTAVSIRSAQTNQVGRVGLSIEQTDLKRLHVTAFSNDGVFRIVGSFKSDGTPGRIEEAVFDGCAGRIEILGHPGSVKFCYLNNHIGGYGEVTAPIDGVADCRPGVSFLRGLPLDLVGHSPAPAVLPLGYPMPGETLSVGWILKAIVTLTPVPEISQCGYLPRQADADASP